MRQLLGWRSDDLEGERDHVVNQVVPQVLEEVAGAIGEAPLGAINLKGCLGMECLLFKEDVRRKADLVCSAFHCEVSANAIHKGRWAVRAGHHLFDGKRCGWILGDIEKIVALEMLFKSALFTWLFCRKTYVK